MKDIPIPAPPWGRPGAAFSGCKADCDQGDRRCTRPDLCFPFVDARYGDLHQQPDDPLHMYLGAEACVRYQEPQEVLSVDGGTFMDEHNCIERSDVLNLFRKPIPPNIPIPALRPSVWQRIKQSYWLLAMYGYIERKK